MTVGAGVALPKDKTINNTECVDRILTIVGQLQQQAENTETDVQTRIQRAVDEKQHSLEDAYRRQQELMIAEAKEATRNEVTQTMSKKFDLEISQLRADFDRRLQSLLVESETGGNLKLERALAEAQKTVRKQSL